MRVMKIVGLVGVFLSLTLVLAASKQTPSYRNRVDVFFARLMETKVNAGYDELLVGSPIRDKASSLKRLREKTAEALIHSGQPVGVELIREQKYGDSLVQLVYVLKFDEAPLIWEFYFYRAGVEKGWTLVNLRFDVDLELLPNR